MSDTDIAAVPPDVALLGMVRAARLEGLPEPASVHVSGGAGSVWMLLTEQHAAAWCAWWTRHGATGWSVQLGGNYYTGWWRGAVIGLHVQSEEVPA